METNNGNKVMINVSLEEFIKVGSDAFSEQAKMMIQNKILAPYVLIEFYKHVISAYREGLTAMIEGRKPDEKHLAEIQLKISLAIDRFYIHDITTEELESLKEEMHHLRFTLLDTDF